MRTVSRLCITSLTAAGWLTYACGSSPEIPEDSGGGEDSSSTSGGTSGGDDSGGLDGVDGFGGSGEPVDPCEADPDSCEEEPPPDPSCGDGRINQAEEQCDDGNGESGDGCTATCVLEQDYACPTPGKPCVSTVECGDGKIGGAETCDDGNVESSDGCSASCRLEEGWACPFPGIRCEAAQCGDGLIAGNEECDFLQSTIGCVACKIADGYDCDAAGCALTECGNGLVERGEQCEDGNDEPFDGCYKCKFEPSCTGGVCRAVCGDGQRYEGEACDDGNLRNGDGCSSTCEIEGGFQCTDVASEPPPSVALPIIYRDFIGAGNSRRSTTSCYRPGLEGPSVGKTTPCYHVNFNNLGADGILDVVASTLGPNGKPVLDCQQEDCQDNPGVTNGVTYNGYTGRRNFSTATDFATWYDSSSAENIVVLGELTLARGTGPLASSYVYDAQERFFPLDGQGWVHPSRNEENTVSFGGRARNYSFTSETRFWFEYQGGERFEFDGDDDVWVFVNGQLTVDLGGLHGPKAATFTLDATNGSASVTSDHLNNVNIPRRIPPGPAMGTARGAQTVNLGLTIGGVYEVAMFHAERNQTGSNFKITLKDFNRPKSECRSICGDGEVASDELCDDGPGGNTGGYGECTADCRGRGPYCGDASIQASGGEQCDDGVNLSRWVRSQNDPGCAPGCVKPPYCGDGTVQSDFEQCDDGAENNQGGYGQCTEECTLGPRCGDGIVQKSEGEECDDGNRVNGDGCNNTCKKSTGGPR